MQNTSTYTPMRPAGQPAIRMRWSDLLFIHWPMPVDAVRPLVPEGLEIDTFGGSAWVGLIPFTMPVIRPRLWPSVLAIGGVTRFHECNVRTYVIRDGQPGVWFLSLDAASAVGVWLARRFWNLPYFKSQIDLERRAEGEIAYSVRREAREAFRSPTAMRCRWRVDDALPRSEPGTLEHFLTERYMLYAANRAGALFRGHIWHEPWSLRRASLMSLSDLVVNAAGVDVAGAGEPVVFAADPLDVEAWKLERV